jgi:hypothetical protein
MFPRRSAPKTKKSLKIAGSNGHVFGGGHQAFWIVPRCPTHCFARCDDFQPQAASHFQTVSNGLDDFFATNEPPSSPKPSNKSPSLAKNA